MAKLTKGKPEVKISEEMIKFEKEFVGRRPGETDTNINLSKVERPSRRNSIIGFVSDSCMFVEIK